MRFQQYAFSLSSKTHRSIHVHTTAHYRLVAFSTVHVKTSENDSIARGDVS